jgi:hypothetical protein
LNEGRNEGRKERTKGGSLHPPSISLLPSHFERRQEGILKEGRKGYGMNEGRKDGRKEGLVRPTMERKGRNQSPVKRA